MEIKENAEGIAFLLLHLTCVTIYIVLLGGERQPQGKKERLDVEILNNFLKA